MLLTSKLIKKLKFLSNKLNNKNNHQTKLINIKIKIINQIKNLQNHYKKITKK